MPAATLNRGDTTTIVTRDLCDVSFALADVRRSIEDAENALIDAHSDLRPVSEVIAGMVVTRDRLTSVIQEAIEIAGAKVPSPSVILTNADILAEAGARR